MVYTDKKGYKRKGKKHHSNLVHRNRAYHIYLENKDKYPLHFSSYEVHHKDGNKRNNRIDNLAILTPQEHDDIHDRAWSNTLSRRWFWVRWLFFWPMMGSVIFTYFYLFHFKFIRMGEIISLIITILIILILDSIIKKLKINQNK